MKEIASSVLPIVSVKLTKFIELVLTILADLDTNLGQLIVWLIP